MLAIKRYERERLMSVATGAERGDTSTSQFLADIIMRIIVEIERSEGAEDDDD